MGVATRFLFSISISLACVSGCLSASAEVPRNKVRFNIEPGSPYSGSVWGANYYLPKSIDLKIFSDSTNINGYDGSSKLQNYWNITGPDGDILDMSSKLDLDYFDGSPTLQFFGDWVEAYPTVLSSEISLVGDIGNSNDAFFWTTSNRYFYENVPIICDGNVDCGEWKSANPNGVTVEIDPVDSGGTFSIYVANNPNSIGDIDQGAGACFEQDGLGVKVPESKTCSTDDEKFSGEYTSLKVEYDGRLTLGGNLILDEGFTSFEVQNNARVEGKGGLVKAGPQTTVLRGTGTFAYKGDVFVQGGVLDIQNPTALGSVSGETSIEAGASLQLSLTGSKNSNGNYKEISFDEPLVIDGGTILFPGNKTPAGDSSDDLGSNIALKGPIQISENGAAFETSIVGVGGDGNRRAKISATVSGDGNFQKTGEGSLVLRDADFGGFTGNFLVSEGILALVQDYVIPKVSNVDISEGSNVQMSRETMNQSIASLTGNGKLNMVIEGQELRIGNDDTSSPNEFKGRITGIGSLVKDGTNTLVLSGKNTYTGSTTVKSGRLTLANDLAIDQLSSTVVNSTGQLDLYTYSANNALDRGKEFNINQVEIKEGGRLFVSARNPLVSESIELNANESGGIAVEIFEKTEGRERNKAPIRVSDEFDYQSGSLVVQAPVVDDPEGRWNIIDGKVVSAEDLAKNTYLVTSGINLSTYKFDGINSPTYGPAMYKSYLEDGSLNLIIEAKTPEELQCQLNPDDCSIGLPSPDEGVGTIPPIDLPSPEGPQTGNELPVELPSPEGPQTGNELPDVDGDGDGELDALPGCEVDSDLCDIISDIPGDEDDALGQEEDLAGDVIDGLLDGLAEEEIDLPLSFDYGQLARLITSGLLPRNVDAPGRSLFNYNNLLVDTVFERLPLRQFTAVEVAEAVEEEAVIVEPEAVVPAEPIRGLWSQAEGMDEQQALQYLKQRVAQGDQVVVEDVDFELDGIGYVEDPSLTGQYANRDGVRAWYRAFGGDTGPSKTSTLYGDYNASASGMVLGADVSLGSNVQIGVFGNYGDVNLYQYSGDTGSGSWNPTGWGGGITADWWSKNFYVQGLISASSFSGYQKRNIIAINEQFGNETARGDKTVTSYSYALRLGAPFEAGRLLLEPQFTAAWTQNQESGFTENGADQLNLRYGSRTTNFLQTELGMKFALPIKSGERAEWVPNLRVAWLGDWNQNNEDQSIGYAFTDQTVGVDSLEENQNGVLIEGGLDYTMANINNGSWKLYVRGGAEVWGGERGTDWRASGGMTWQF